MKKSLESKKKDNLNDSNIKSLLTIIFTIGMVLICMLGYKLFLESPYSYALPSIECNCPKCQACESASSQCNYANATSVGEKVTTLKKMEVTEANQSIKIGGKTFNIRKDSDGALYVDDEKVISRHGDEYYADYLYLTDKFAIFTNGAQFKEYIGYALSETGAVAIIDGERQMDNFKLVNGYLHAKGGIPTFNAIDLNIEEKDLVIKLVDNILTVAEA